MNSTGAAAPGSRRPRRPRPARALLDLRRVAVRAADLVRAHALAGLGQVRGEARRAPRARRPALGIDDDPGRAYQPALEQRRDREDRRGREAARHGDQLRRAQRRAVALGQAVDRLGHETHRGMLMLAAIARRARPRIAQPEVGGQIEREHAPRAQRRTDLGAVAVGQRRERDRRAGRDRVGVERLDRQIDAAGELREDLGEPLAGRPAGADRDQLDVRMRREDANQLRAGVAGRADDRDRRAGRRHGGSMPRAPRARADWRVHARDRA